MRQKPPNCIGCPLAKLNGGFSMPAGMDYTDKQNPKPYPNFNGVLIIGEALGEQEKYFGTPFVPSAEAGSTLHAAFRQLNVERDDFVIWNIIACQPPGNKLAGRRDEKQIVDHCSKYLDAVVRQTKPKVILALGAIPLKYLTDYTGKSEDKQNITLLRGYKLWSPKYNCIVIPSLHPSFITQMGRHFLYALIRDIKAAIAYAKGTVPDFTCNYISYPTKETLREFIDYAKVHPELPIAYDIETPMTAIPDEETDVDYEVREVKSIQFAIKKGEGLFLLWNKDNEPFIREIFQLSNPKMGWYCWAFDKPILGYHLGEDFMNGFSMDIITLWKHYWSDNRLMGNTLQFATNFASPEFPPWKHIAIDQPEYYGTLDVDAVVRDYWWLRPLTESKRFRSPLGTDQPVYSRHYKNVYQGWEDDILKIRPILDKMSAHGIPIDVPARDIFKKEIDISAAAILKEVQEIYPEHLMGFDLEHGYVKTPKEVFTLEAKFRDVINPHSPNFVLYKDETKALSDYIELNTRTKVGFTGLRLHQFELPPPPKPDGPQVFLPDALSTTVIRYARRKNYKPTSSLATDRYIKWRNHKKPAAVNKNKETTSKDVIFRLAEIYKDPFYKLVNQYRELTKLSSTYIDGWKEYTDKNGYVHSQFKFTPATGQLSSVKPNVMNAPARGNQFSSEQYKGLAERFKTLIRAREGHVIIEIDYASFHALTLGFEAEDPTYMRLVRSDIHSFIGSYMMRAKAITKYQYDLAHGKKYSNDTVMMTLRHLKDLDNWINLSDDELRANLKWMRTNIETFNMVRNSQAKPGILGIGFGLGEDKFYRLNKESFKTEGKAGVSLIYNLLHKLFPKIFIFHDKVRVLADEQKYLVSRGGYIRHFHDVIDRRILTELRDPRPGEIITTDNKQRRWVSKPGTQAESAIAFLPANDAFSKIKEAMRQLEDEGLNSRYNFFNNMHDALLFECPIALINECVENVTRIMELPSKVLYNNVAPDGLVCRTEAKVGWNWGEMKDYKKGMILNGQ